MAYHCVVVFSLVGAKDPWRFSLRKAFPHFWANSSMEWPPPASLAIGGSVDGQRPESGNTGTIMCGDKMVYRC